MARTCSICVHPKHAAINAALVAGEPYRAVAQRFAASRDAVFRHKRDHIPTLVAKAVAANDAAEVAEAGSLLEQTHHLYREAREILAQAKADGDGRLALLAVAAAARVLELEAKVNGGRPVEPPVQLLWSFDASAYPPPPTQAEVAAPTRVNGSAVAVR